MKLRLIAFTLLLTASSSLPGQELLVNGSPTFANVPIGGTLDFQLTGLPNAPHVWGFNTGPGPSTLLGVSVPLLLDGNELDIGNLMPLSATGVRNESYVIAYNLGLVGVTLYSAAAYLDPNSPFGFTVTNGVGFRFVREGTSAGPNAAAWTGQEITLDGSGTLQTFGGQPPSLTFQWSLIGGPAGANVVLREATTAFPAFSADQPGVYTVEVQTQSALGLGADQVQIAVYSLNLAGLVDGGFSTSAVNIAGTITGPGVQTFSINGVATGLSAGGAFSGGTLTPSALMNPITARAVTPSGAVLEKTITVINGASAALGSLGVPGTAIRIGGATLDALEPPVELLLANIPLDPVISAIPAIPVINTAVFSATIDPTGATYDSNVDFDLFPASNGIGIAITLNNLTITSNLTGTILFGGPYAETATITASSAVISGQLVIGSNATGGISTSVQNSATVLNNFNMAVTGTIGGLTQISVIQVALRALIELTLTGVLQLIPTALNPVLGGIVLSVNLTATGIPMQVDFPFNAVNYDANGLTIANDFRATALVPSPTAPLLQGVLSTPSPLPTFGATTPVQSLPYDFAFGASDEFLNQFLAALVQVGSLDLNFSGMVGTGSTAAVLTADAMNTLLPNCGFEAFPATTPIQLQVRHTTAPAINLLPMGQTTMRLALGNIQLAFSAETAPGIQVPVLTAGVTSETAITISIDPQTGALVITTGATTLTTSAELAFAGRDAGPNLVGLSQIVQNIVPLILGPLSQIPLPTTGLGVGTVAEISVSNEMALTYLDAP